MPITLATLFCTPQDVWDTLSTEGVDLRLDDHGLASGYVIQTSAPASAGDTALAVDNLEVPLLSGSILSFDGAGMVAPVAVQLTAAANLGATSLAVSALSTALPAGAQARDSGVNAATGARLVVATRKGTSKVKFYCNGRYDDSQLVLSGTALDWATIVAARWLCSRRGQAAPGSLEADYEEAIEEMRMVQAGVLQLEDIGTRGCDWPTVTNVIVNPSYDGMRSRVQQNISEQSTTAFPHYIDWNSARLFA